uniref:ABC transporter domain-containing protein n=1 Tax=Timema monikensis TaxID=170555 RepID=A0A7R9EEJ5_9NEOP|nr:unnamed protein product [Timema monikensis]
MSAILRKFSLVLWKNFVIRKRHWLLTLFEIAIPIILFAIMALIKSNVNTTHGPIRDATYFSTTNLESISQYFRFSNPVVYYTPDSEPQRTIMNRVKEKLNIRDLAPLSSESELVDRMLGQNDSLSRYAYGVVFEGSVGTKFNYKIRPEGRHWYTDTLYPSAVFNGPSQNSDSYFNDFISLQHALDTSFIEYVSKTSQLPFDYTMQMFPYPAYVEEVNMSDLNRIMLPIMTVLSFLMLCPSILKRVVEEKHTGVKELMKMMGLKTWMLWGSWMVNALAVNLITVTIIVIIMTVPLNDSGTKVMPDADWSVLWLFLVLYCVASVTSLFAVSTFFSRPTIAMSFGIILWLVSYFVPFGALQSGNSVSLGLKMLSSLLPNMAVYWGFDIFSTFEARGVNLNWTKLGDSPSGSGNDLTMLHVLLMLLVDIMMYSLVTWYVDAIMPGKYGLAQPWYFVFTCSFWRVGRVESLGMDVGDEHLNFESPPDGVKVGIEIKELRKVFYKFGGMTKKVAVDGVTMNVYQGQITALLGHNGAGKTTTMSVLTGMYSPTSGSVFVDGYDIRHDMDKVRESLGLCPQHNLLFTDLTVIEHLVFFAMLKGSSRQSARTEANSLLGRLNLTAKSNQLADTLSGGMKRKLSLAIALIGDSKVLMLDEPTSGMDPEARREIWDLLLSMRGHRTILITTHFMEEADVLGDFIAIMDHGRVHCYGTSLFLKNIYGTGYHLKLMRQETCDVARITRLIQEMVPQSAPSSSVGSELSYTLPSDQAQHFPALFDILDRDKAALGVTGIGVSITTLEEVFLKVKNYVSPLDYKTICVPRVGVEAGEEQRGTSRSSSEVTDSQLLIKNGLGEDLVYKKVRGVPLCLQQFRALFIKKVIYTYRKIFIHVLMGLIPVVMIALTIVLGSQGTAPSSNQEPPRTFSLGDYRPDTVPFTVNNTAVPANLVHSYQTLVGNSPLTSESVSSSVLALGLKNIVAYNNKLVAGAEFSGYNDTTTTVNAMFSTGLFHAAPVSLNVLNNAVLGHLMGSDYTITATNHPLPNNQNLGSLYLLSESDVIFQWMTLVPLGLLFLVGLFMIFPLTERVTSVKQLQLMAGVSPPSYWLVCFLWDYLLYLLVSVLMVLAVYVFDALNIFKQTEELCEFAERGVLFLILALYGLSGVPFAYLFSYLNKTSAGGFVLLIVTNMVVGLIMTMVVYALEQSVDYEATAMTLTYIMNLLPHFALSKGLMNYSQQVVKNNECALIRDVYKKTQCDHNPASKCCGESLNLFLDFPQGVHSQGTAPEGVNSQGIASEGAHSQGTAPEGALSGHCSRGDPQGPTANKMKSTNSTKDYPYLGFHSKSNPCGAGLELVYLGLDMCLYAALILLLDYGLVGRAYERLLKAICKTRPLERQVDVDVAEEQDRVDGQIAATHSTRKGEKSPGVPQVVTTCSVCYFMPQAGTKFSACLPSHARSGDNILRLPAISCPKRGQHPPPACYLMPQAGTTFSACLLSYVLSLSASRTSRTMPVKHNLSVCKSAEGLVVMTCLHVGRDLPSSGRILSRSHRYELVPMSGDPPRSSRKSDTDLGLAMRGAASPEEDILVAHELEKCYGLRRFHAVKGISFGVRPGECFGLLGVNGAGKTTTFKMLTGDEVPTQGNAYLGHCALSRDRGQFLSQLGYCPQFDALNETLTGQEMLQLFAHLRGTPREAVSHEVAKWTNLLGLQEYATRLCGTYSGGNKRKLSTAMALIGDPPIVFLDEPTSGVDPVARRNLWNVLAQIQSTGQSIVLTSHSMEECEALCNRLAIMVNGQFVCMGGCQYLKHKFGQGFTVMIKLRSIGSEDNLKLLKVTVEEQFQPSCVLKDEHQGLLHYHIQDPHVPWKVLFLGMERLKGAHQIVEDYTISETTLEQVFLAFARAQKQGN